MRFRQTIYYSLVAEGVSGIARKVSAETVELLITAAEMPDTYIWGLTAPEKATMPSPTDTERREHARYPLSTGLHFYHEPTKRYVPARCENISQGGLKMFVPARTPVKAGDSLQVRVGATDRPEFAMLSDQPLDTSVVRVDRQALLTSGHLAVGVKFI